MTLTKEQDSTIAFICMSFGITVADACLLMGYSQPNPQTTDGLILFSLRALLEEKAQGTVHGA